MARQPAVGRLDRMIGDLERLQGEAQEIFDSHVDVIKSQCPNLPFGVIKTSEITNRAGSALNYIAALKIVREAMTK